MCVFVVHIYAMYSIHINRVECLENSAVFFAVFAALGIWGIEGRLLCVLPSSIYFQIRI